MDYVIPPHILEKIKEAERMKQERMYRRPYLEIPLPPPYMDPPRQEDEDEPRRGPIVIDIDTYEIIEEDNE